MNPRRPFAHRALVIGSLAAGLLTSGLAPKATFALTGATVIDANGKPAHDVTIVVAGNRIQAIGHGVGIPAGARRIDARGSLVTTGLFDAASHVGLAEVGQDDESKDGVGGDDARPVSAGVRIVDGFDPNDSALPITRTAGITTAALVPSGGMIAGQGAVVDLAGSRNGGGTVVRSSVGLFGTLAPQDAGLPGAAGRGRLMAALREVLAIARQAPPAGGWTGRLPFQMGLLDLAALRTATAGSRTLFLAAHRESDIQAALRLAREEHLKLVLLGAEEGWMTAREIAAAGVPVILDPFVDLPTSLDRRGSRLDNAALLHRAGVRLAFGTWSASNARNLRQAAGIAVANGLPWDVAWHAVTREPASIYGVGDRYGDLAPGKIANLVQWDGDPFEPGTDVKALFIAGNTVALDDRQSALARRYRLRPAHQ